MAKTSVILIAVGVMAAIALGVGLGIGLGKSDDPESTEAETTTEQVLTSSIPASTTAEVTTDTTTQAPSSTTVSTTPQTTTSPTPTPSPEQFSWTWDETSDIENYINYDDGYYNWTYYQTKHESDLAILKTYNLTSQKWLNESLVYDIDEETGEIFNRSIWWHSLMVFIPKQSVNPDFANTAVLLIDGGSNKHNLTPRDSFDEVAQILFRKVELYQVPIAIVKNVPNEPIYFTDDNPPKRRNEDSIIAKTWHHFVENLDDKEWLLRFPMTKAASKAMTAVTEILQEEENLFGLDVQERTVDKFSVGGASKRGWTTWMSAATDKRVISIWPMVLDILNLNTQLHNMYRSLGGWTFAFDPYWQENITTYIDSPEIELMQRQIDPYYYRKRLTVPKIVVSAAGDEFFLPDDSHQYFNNLPGKKYVYMCPDVEHGTVELGTWEFFLFSLSAILCSILYTKFLCH